MVNLSVASLCYFSGAAAQPLRKILGNPRAEQGTGHQKSGNTLLRNNMLCLNGLNSVRLGKKR